MKETKSIAIVLAAGQSKRMQSKTAKQYLLLDGKPVLYYSLKAFEDSAVEDIVLVTGAGEREYVQREIVEKYGFQKVHAIVEGGKERYHSVYLGLQAADRLACGEAYVLIHDGARPFIDKELIARTVSCVREYKACVVGMPVKDTIKIADADGYAAQTPDRNLVWSVQTPQAFAMELIVPAYAQLVEREKELLAQGVRITDDAGVAELFGACRVKLVEGSYRNIKITTPEDLLAAEAFLKS